MSSIRFDDQSDLLAESDDLIEKSSTPINFSSHIVPLDASIGACDARSLSLKIHACETWDELAGLSVQGICAMMGAVNARWMEVSANGNKALWTCSLHTEHDEFFYEHLEGMVERARELGAFCRKVGEMMQVESDEMLKLSSYMSHTAMSSNAYVQDYLVPMEITDLLGMQVLYSRGGSGMLFLGLPDGEIDPGLLEDLEFIRAHIRMAAGKLCRMASLCNLTSALQELWRKERSMGISVISSDGCKLWETDNNSVKIFAELGGDRDAGGKINMPASICRWTKGVISSQTRVCAQSGTHTRDFISGRKQKITATLLLERAGNGALLLLQRDTKNGQYGGVFTRRELEVIRCIKQGMTSNAVAERLRISKRTVDKHLENIYTKLGVGNRVMALRRLDEM